MVSLFTYVLGIIFGVVGLRLYQRYKKVGVIRFYDSEPGESPVATAEFYEPIEMVRKRKCVTFDISQK